jgi:hypothetical protein
MFDLDASEFESFHLSTGELLPAHARRWNGLVKSLAVDMHKIAR